MTEGSSADRGTDAVPALGQYERELSKLPHTYDIAMSMDVLGLRSAIVAASQSSLIGVGSGGSFTVASLLCNLHESHTGRVSRPSTPLEIICNPTLASTSPAFFISAEGKNPDIVEALVRSRHHSARPIHVVTNHEHSELMVAVAGLRDVTPHVFPLPDKDGYLATNSLLLDSILVARAFGELDPSDPGFPKSLHQLSMDGVSVDDWIESATAFLREVASRGSLIVLFAPSLRPVATDLESKLAESAMVHVQLADFRAFAHGRHLWLAERPKDCAILALVDPPLLPLWHHMQNLMPCTVPRLELRVQSKVAAEMVAALVAALRAVWVLGHGCSKDPGRPHVPEFGRSLYYADLSSLVPSATEDSGGAAEDEKFAVLGTRWPYTANQGAMRRAREKYQTEMEGQTFRAIVFDYDGTLRTTQQEDLAPSGLMVEELCRLTRAGIVVGIVSGRGGSLRERLREAIPAVDWPRIHLGLYNGGWQTTLDSETKAVEGTSEFLQHVTRIARKLQGIGVPIQTIRTTLPYQVSVRFREGVDTEAMWFVLADALRQAGLALSGMVRSRHSIDVLAPEISKSHVIANLIQQQKLLPHDLLTIGDQGAWPGNDAALLEHRFSLSVDLPSRRLDRGWKLAPIEKRGVDATLWYLERSHLTKAPGLLLHFDQPRSGGAV